MNPGEQLERIRGLLDSLGDLKSDIQKTGADLGRVSMAQKALTDELIVIFDISKELNLLVGQLKEVRWMNTREIAKHTRTSVSTIRKWRRSGLIPYYKPAGADCRYNVEEVDEAIKKTRCEIE